MDRTEEVLGKLVHTSDPDKNRIRLLMGRPPVKSSEILDEAHYPLLEDRHLFPIWMCYEWSPLLRNAEEISRRLKIKLDTVKEKIKALLQLKLLETQNGVEFHHSKGGLVTTNEIPHQSIQKFHQNSLDLAQRALTSLSPKERNFQSLVFAGSNEAMAEIKEEISKCLDRIEAIAELHKENSNDVYQFSVHFFPIRFGDPE